MCRSLEPSPARDPSPSPSPSTSPPVAEAVHADQIASGDRGPVETLPVETLPVETLPVETLPVETLPVETACDPSRILEGYQSSLVRLLLAVVEGLARNSDVGVSSRTVTNFLRGNQQPPASVGNGSLLKLYGALARCPSGWIQEVVRSLIESGEVEEVDSDRTSASSASPAPGGPTPGSSTPGSPARPGRIRLSSWGRKLLRSSDSFSIDVLPRAPCLGTHPELETALWDLRRRLAAEDARAPFSIFPNSTLAALASTCPRDLGELAGIPGFGEARIRKYGRAVLEVLRNEGGASAR